MTTNCAKGLILLTVCLRIDCLAGLGIPAAVAQAAPADSGSPAPAANEQAAETSGNKSTEGRHAVIPPGQEELLADMLGRGAPFAQDCKFAAGHADGQAIRATYACPSGQVVFVLVHPSQAPPTAAQTERFAITLQSGSPPDRLLPDLTSRIRSRESAFQWLWVGEEAAASRSSLRGIILAAAGVVGLTILLWARGARRSARRTQER